MTIDTIRAQAKRANFTHQDVGKLMTAYGKGGLQAALDAFPHMDPKRVSAKLEELGALRITPAARVLVDQFVGEIQKQENAPLVARTAIRALRKLGGE